MDESGKLMNVHRIGAWGSLAVFAGILLSGPLSMWLVSATHPQPAWQNADAFFTHYHSMQALPYYFGFLIIAGFVVLIAALHRTAREQDRLHTLLAVIFTTVFAALISLNYIFQTTFVPALVGTRDPLSAAFTMANPRSLGWALEMWGYGMLGVGTWFAARAFHGSKLERVTGVLFMLNGILSIITALWTAIDIGWVLTVPGLIGFVIWNLLILVMSALAWVVMRRRIVVE